MIGVGRRALFHNSLLRAITLGAPLSLIPVDAGAAPPLPLPHSEGSMIDVRAMGAVGDGVSDDTAAFQATLNSGSTVFVPPGTYKLTKTLSLNGATMFGTGPNSVLKCGNAIFNVFEVSGSRSRLRSVMIEGAAVNESTEQFAIVTSKTAPPEDFAVTDVHFSNLNSGIKFEARAKNCRVENSHFERLIGTTSGHGYGVLSGAVDGLIITGNTFCGSRDARQGRHAVYISAGGRKVIASHNIICEFSHEAMCTNAYEYHHPVEQLIFSDNIIHRCGSDASNQSSISITGKARSIKITGNIVVESFGCGILCDAGSVGQENISVDDNVVIDSAYIGIRQLGALQQTVRNNFVRGSSRIKPGSWADIMVGAGRFAPEHILVSGNQCVAVPGVSFKPFVLSNATPLPLSVKIFGNDFPARDYTAPADYALGVLQPEIDGRLQLRTHWQPPPLTEMASVTTEFAVAGAAAGDVVLCSHPSAKAGIMMSATIESPDSVIITFVNVTGRARTFASGILSIDVWKSDVPAT